MVEEEQGLNLTQTFKTSNFHRERKKIMSNNYLLFEQDKGGKLIDKGSGLTGY